MNPDEDLPEEVRDRAYHAQPVWKRIVVIAAGPAVNLVLAFVLLFIFFALIGPQTGSSDVGQLEKGYPAQGVLKPGDRLVAVDGQRGNAGSSCRNGSPPTRVRRSRRRRAARPPSRCRSRSCATGATRTYSITPIYDPVAERTRLGFAYAAGPREDLGVGEAFDLTANRFWFITQEHAGAARPPDQPGAAQGDLGRRRLLRGHAPDDS